MRVRARWDEEPTGQIPRLLLGRLIEETRPPVPAPTFVVTIRTPARVLPPADDDFLDEQPASVVAPAPIVAEPTIPTPSLSPTPVSSPQVAQRTYAARIATVLVACVITLGGCLVLGMLFS
jgi:hypothetical protein